MRFTILTLLLLPISVFGQFINDSLPELPFNTKYYNDFETDIGGWTAFNGGAVASVSGALEVSNGAGGARGGILSGYTNEASTRYRLMINVSNLSAGVTSVVVYSQWATRIDTLFGTGWHTIYFDTDASPGGFGNNLILTPAGAVGTASVEILQYGPINEGRDVYSIGELDDSVSTSMRSVGKIWGNGFEVDIDGVNTFGVASPSSPVNGAFELTTTATGQIACFACNEFLDTQSFEVFIDIDIVDAPVTFRSVWGTSNVSSDITLAESGVHVFNMSRRGPQASAELDGLTAFITGGGTIRVNDIIISAIDYNTANQQVWVELGSNASVSQKIGNPVLNSTSDGSVSIGFNSEVGGEGIAIGDSAIAKLDGSYGTVGGDDMMAIGHKSKSYGWRNTAIGNRAHAAGQSSTAVGTGAVALMPHSTAVGRGAFLGNYNNETGNSFLTDGEILYLSNGWAHRFDTPLSGIGVGDDIDPTTIEVKIYAQDAFDSRAVPSDVNISAGHLGLYSGRGTGSGEGGEVRIYTAPQEGVGGNVKNDPVMSAKFDSDAGVSTGTDLWLLDRSDDTLKRVKYDKPAVSGTNKIIGFTKLYLE